MSTKTDTDFTSRLSPQTISGMVAAETTLANWTPSQNAINTGMLSDIGRAIIKGAPVFKNNFYSRYMDAPLQRGDSFMMGRFGEISSRAYNPSAGADETFSAETPSMTAYVAKKNLSRQIALKVADRWLKQFVQTPEMIGDAMAAIMQSSTACYYDDLWVAAKGFVSGSTRGAKATQMVTMTNEISTTAGQEELLEIMFKYSQNKFRFKSTEYNAAGYNTMSEKVNIALTKDCQYEMYKKLSDTFAPQYLQMPTNIDYVDDFATPAGKPSGAGALLGMMTDEDTFHFAPMPDGVVTESFRVAAGNYTNYFTTYETAYGQDLTQNCVYIFAPSA